MNNRFQTKPVKMRYRIASGFILLCTLLAAFGFIVELVVEPTRSTHIIGLAVVVLMFHINVKITFTGFAPKYLLFAHDEKYDT